MRKIVQATAFKEVVSRLSSRIKNYDDACKLLRLNSELGRADFTLLLRDIEASDLEAELQTLINEYGFNVVIKLIEAYSLESATSTPQKGISKPVNSRSGSPRIAISRASVAKVDAIAAHVNKSRGDVVEMAIQLLVEREEQF